MRFDSVEGVRRRPFQAMARRAITLAALVAYVSSASCGFGALCEEINLAQSQSSDGVYGAKAYYIDCGAVGEFSLKLKLTQKSQSGYTNEHHVLDVPGRFTATFAWPEPRLLRVTVKCEMEGQCDAAAVEHAQKTLATSDRSWEGMTIDYAFAEPSR